MPVDKNKEAMYEGSRVNVKDERGSTLSLRAALHTLPLFYLRTSILRGYERKNYATVEIHPEG